MTLHNIGQAWLARWLHDPLARDAGFTSPEPAVHFSLASLALYLLLGLALPRTVPLSPALRGWRIPLTLLAGPLLLLLAALLLLLLQRLQQLTLSGFDALGLALGRAAYTLAQHAVFFCMPLPDLDVGRTLALSGPRVLKQAMGTLSGAGRLLAYILWLLLALSGALTSVTDPLWRGLNSLVGWLP
ncbi:hypothetical protein MF271_05940 [Deinococcus sp. KNUC1210]|uniref:hypothetical protein n=1 Tax=Deinococcus sp. KNUC1210 TaxID=2917691 RepID=UPI001EF136EB|nr:hypothetical protein [Deinococcus sp. KNUC1210]ULH16156.1 hypothetical protein MF271_05940 [Deinococcus sp. KNUC1210]